MNNAPIGVFDSGVGGLTILSELKKLLPNESFIYFADSKFSPYGSKTQKELNSRTSKITDFLLSKQIKTLVIACNTATIQSIEHLRKQFSLPIIGVVPVVKTLSLVSKTKRVAIFATPSTTNSGYLDSLIRKFANDLIVYKRGETGLEILIEQGDLTSPKIDSILRLHLSQLKKNRVDVIALGCTHYPFLKEKMQAITGKKITILDSGGAVARQTQRILIANKTSSLAKSPKDWYYTTGSKSSFEKIHKVLTGKQIKATHVTI